MLSEGELRYSSQSVYGNTSACVLVDCIQEHCERPVCPRVVGMNRCHSLADSILIPCNWNRLCKHTVCELATYNSPPLYHTHFNICFPNVFPSSTLHLSTELLAPLPLIYYLPSKWISTFPLIFYYLLFSNTFSSQLPFIIGATCCILTTTKKIITALIWGH